MNKQWKQFLHDDPILWRSGFAMLLYINDLGWLHSKLAIASPSFAWKKWLLVENIQELPKVVMVMLRLDGQSHPVPWQSGFMSYGYMSIFSNSCLLENSWPRLSTLNLPPQSLHFCIIMGFQESLEFLLENLSSLPTYLNSYHDDGCTPLHLACKYGKFHVVKTLVHYYPSLPLDLYGVGADVIAIDNNHIGIGLFVSMHFANK